ncbi:MAG: hypothetical protein EOO40_00100 [Deltaproteobacteria bacterium]|nr:MAG: hypothetical protein EOO40_00100 [Deltaproteobacteria bacterium]
MADKRKLYDQQPGESTPAFEAFCAYRDLGPERSIAKASHKLQKSKSTLEDWARVNGWQTRIAAYNTAADRADRKVRRQAIQKMADRHSMIAAMFQEKVILRLHALDVNTLSPSDLIRMFEVSAKVERESRRFGTHDVAEATAQVAEMAEAVGVPVPKEDADAVALVRQKRRGRLDLADAIRGESLADILGTET